ncbi:unnamed protein product [Cuscuta campestris]|uniref:Uncharacterized protein n=1 Tax=Cuscuta campestris TaxID=132261 RepID=A0A484KXP1_9ASTE|nr:unnamed protein product [Cuscuta campestris]
MLAKSKPSIVIELVTWSGDRISFRNLSDSRDVLLWNSLHFQILQNKSVKKIGVSTYVIFSSIMQLFIISFWRWNESQSFALLLGLSIVSGFFHSFQV